MATKLIRSVGVTQTDLAGAETMTIVASTMTITAGFSNLSIGIGDAIEWDDGDPQLAFIHGRISATVWTVKDKDGAEPVAASAGQDFSVFRCYSGMNNAGLNVINVNITEPTADDVKPAFDMVAADIQVDFICYADATDTIDAGTSASWVSDATHFLHFFTPVTLAQVGVTQRFPEPGVLVAGTVAFRLETTNGSDSALQPTSDFMCYTGLQIVVNEDTNERSAVAASSNMADSVQIAKCIFVGVYTSSGSGHGLFNNDGASWLVSNTLIYGFTLSAVKSHGSSGSMTAYHVTVIGGTTGFTVTSSGSMLVKNCIGQDTSDLVYLASGGATFDSGSTNNLADDGSADNGADNLAAGIDDVTLVFRNKAGDNYNLHDQDALAVRGGIDLTADGIIAVADDIVGTARTAPVSVGAFRVKRRLFVT